MTTHATEKRKDSVLRLYLRLLPVAFRAHPILFLLSHALSALHSLSWGVATLFTQRFFDAAAMVAQGNAPMRSAATSLMLLGTVYLANQVLNGVGNFVPQVYADKARGELQRVINGKMGRIEPVCFEDTAMLDHINKANQGMSHAIWFVLTVSIIFTFYVPYFAFMSWYLFSLKPILAVSIVIIFVPTALTQIIRAKVFARLEDKSAPIRREYDYYEMCIVGREYFKETRLLGAFSFFLERYRDALRLLNELSWRANFRTSLYELLMKVSTLAGYLGILYMLFVALMNREISVGAFAAVFASIGGLFAIMEEVVCGHLGTVAQNLGTISNYVRFLDIPERHGKDIILDKSCDITLDCVSFSYPGSDSQAVKNVSLCIRSGETIAIVGENGSGKSTLVRLITGLYLPSEGAVSYENNDTRSISMSSLFQGVSGVFQRYQRYQMTLKNNICISDAGRDTEDEELDLIVRMAGLDVTERSFDSGYETMLSREFGGVDLSGGQWQRVAIARGFYRIHQIIVLDEPTAAIDPLEETKIYNRFAEISKDKTAIIVTHRLGSVKLADRIVVMDKGKIVGIGTHSDLVLECPKYREMWTAQAQYYVL